MKSLRQVIRDNQRFHRHERLLRHIRLPTYQYQDAGKLEKAQRVIATIKIACGPTWERKARRLEDKALDRRIQ